MAAMKDRLIDLLEDYEYHKSLKDNAETQGKRGTFVYAVNAMGLIRTQLQNLNYDVTELEF